MGACGRATRDACLMFPRFYHVAGWYCPWRSIFVTQNSTWRLYDTGPDPETYRNGPGHEQNPQSLYCDCEPQSLPRCCYSWVAWTRISSPRPQDPSTGMPRQRVVGRLQSRKEFRLYGFRVPCPLVIRHDSVHPSQLHLATDKRGEGERKS